MIKNNRGKKDNQWSFKELHALIVRKQFIREERFGVKIGVSEEKTDNVIMNDKKGENEKNTKETELKPLQPTEEKKKMNKSVYDEKLPIIIQSKKCGYDLFKDEICDTNALITKSRKIGYIFTDTKKRILGVVYRSDDERKIYYGMAEILFFKRFKEEFGTWRIIKINGEYLPFDKLEKILSLQDAFSCTTDSRRR